MTPEDRVEPPGSTPPPPGEQYPDADAPASPPPVPAPGPAGTRTVPFAAPWAAGAGGPVAPAAPPGRVSTPVWLLPTVGLLALVLGLVGGAVGAFVVVGEGGLGSSVISVQQRRATPLPADNDSVAAVAQQVLPSTVQIRAEYAGQDQGATGSGWVLDDAGHVVTNNHVVAQAARDDGPIEVIDQRGRHFRATVVGRSTVYDLAVLQAPRSAHLRPVAIGSSRQMRVGETVVAIGSPLGLSATVTSGIVSAVDRPVTTSENGGDSSYINAVQTDAAINPGNSGGPLVNLQGEVVGVNSAIASLGSQLTSDQGGSIGVGFAIPIEQVQVTAGQILRTGRARYPVMGANVQGTPRQDGAKVEEITAGLPAARTRLAVGDVIVEVDGKPVTSSIDVVVAVRAHVPGEKVTLTVQRGGRTFEVQVGLSSKIG